MATDSPTNTSPTSSEPSSTRLPVNTRSTSTAKASRLRSQHQHFSATPSWRTPPTFRWKVGKYTITTRILPSKDLLSLQANFSCEPKAKLSYESENSNVTVTHDKPGELVLLLSNKPIQTYQGFPRDMKIKTASIAAGQLLYEAYGCMTCHSADGAKSHGPTFAKLHGSQRKITGHDAPVVADDAYILESIKTPNAKTVEGFPPNYMPPYVLKQLEYESLVLFIRSLAKGE